MKYIFLLTVGSLLTISVLSAQNTSFETTIRNGFFSYGEYVLAMDNGENIIVGKDYVSGGWGDEILRFDKVDASGNLLWSNSYPALTGEAYSFIDAVKGTDNTFFITGNQGGCDYLDYNDIMKFDANGNLLWVKTTNSLGLSSIGSGSLKAADNGGVWIEGAGVLTELDANGDVAQTVSTNLDYVASYDHSLSTGDFVAFGFVSGDSKLRYIEQTGGSYEVMMSGTIPGDVKFLDNNSVAFLSDDVLGIYDNQLNLINSLDVSGLSASGYKKVLSDNQYIYLTTGRWSLPFNLMKLDYNLNIIDELTTPLAVNDVDIRDNYIKMVGYEYQHIWVKNFNNDFNDTYANTDIGVVNIFVNAADSTCAEFVFSCNCNFEAEGMSVVVKNFGTEVIDYFEVNALYHCLNDCYDAQAIVMTYDNQNLLPGQSTTVNFPDLNLWGYEDTRLCFYTTRPNKLTDKNHDNDEICRDFFNNDIVNVEETGAHTAITIFPNPATDKIQIQGIAEGKYSLVNTVGQIMQTGQLDKEAFIDISALPQGVYFMSIIINNEQVVRRLLKM